MPLEGLCRLKNTFDGGLCDKINVQILFLLLVCLSFPVPEKEMKRDSVGTRDIVLLSHRLVLSVMMSDLYASCAVFKQFLGYTPDGTSLHSPDFFLP
jgi:hypothetical protein